MKLYEPRYSALRRTEFQTQKLHYVSRNTWFPNNEFIIALTVEQFLMELCRYLIRPNMKHTFFRVKKNRYVRVP